MSLDGYDPTSEEDWENPDLPDEDDPIYQHGVFLSELHEIWQPHDGQIGPGHALFYEFVKSIFMEDGRNWGKTELMAYFLYRWAGENPKTENYLFEPFQKQAREILWVTQRLQKLIPDHRIKAINNTEMRITLWNKSFIKLDGSDNDQAYRGIKPRGLVIYDELKDHKKKFIDAMEPNRAAYDSPAIFTGTPPEFENHFTDMSAMAKLHPDWRYFHGPTSQNPYISKKWLESKKKEFELNNDMETWQREYEAVFVRGGKKSIIPQINSYQPIPFDREMFRDKKAWDFFCIQDPGSSSTWAILFVAWNKYQKRGVCLDEFYLQDQIEMSSGMVWPKIFEKIKELDFGPAKDWNFYYDEAAAWFRNETNNMKICEDIWLSPTNKAHNSIEHGISCIRDAFNRKVLDITDRCPKLVWELVRYLKDDKDRIPDKDDHLIDDLRYFFSAVGYELEDVKPPKEPDVYMARRGHTPEEDFAGQLKVSDFAGENSFQSDLEDLE